MMVVVVVVVAKACAGASPGAPSARAVPCFHVLRGRFIAGGVAVAVVVVVVIVVWVLALASDESG